MSEIIKDLCDIGTLIERDSCPALFQWPPLNVEAVRRVGGQQDDFQAISLVFLLTRDVEQVRTDLLIFTKHVPNFVNCFRTRGKVKVYRGF